MATDDPFTEFVSALRDAGTVLGAARGRLAGAAVSDAAFGRLFEAHAVRDTYRTRLPGIEADFGEARAVLDHFIAALDGGHPAEPPTGDAR